MGSKGSKTVHPTDIISQHLIKEQNAINKKARKFIDKIVLAHDTHDKYINISKQNIKWIEENAYTRFNFMKMISLRSYKFMPIVYDKDLSLSCYVMKYNKKYILLQIKDKKIRAQIFILINNDKQIIFQILRTGETWELN